MERSSDEPRQVNFNDQHGCSFAVLRGFIEKMRDIYLDGTTCQVYHARD